MAERRLQENQVPDELLTVTEHTAEDHNGLPGVGETDTVVGASGILNTGTQENALIEPVYGIASSTIAEGDDSRFPSDDETASLAATTTLLTAGNPPLVAADLIGSGTQVGVTANDTTPDFLLNKMAAGLGITLTEINDGGNEDLQVAVSLALNELTDVTSDEANAFNNANGATGANPFATISDVTASAQDEEVKVSANDTTAGFLFDKLISGSNVTLTEVNDGGNEDLRIAVSMVLSDLTDVSVNEAAAFNSANAPTGANPFATIADVGGGTDELLKISANDTTAGFLNGKMIAGSNIVFNEINDGANETLQLNVNMTLSNLTDVSTDEANAFNAASSPTGANPFATISDVTGASDVKDVLISANDTTSGFLDTKLVSGAGITLTENNDGGNETLTIAAIAGPSVDEKIKISANDTTADFLISKITAGTAVVLTENNDGANEDLEIAVDVSAVLDGKLLISSNDTTFGFPDSKFVAGSGISLTENNDGGNETLTIAATGGPSIDEKVKVSANDTTEGFLNGKLVAGTGISLTENNDGANETFTIAATGGPSVDEKVKVSSNDTTPNFLIDKISTTGITLTELSDGGDEGLRFTVDYGTGSVTATVGNDSRIPIQGENDALVGNDGTPSTSNPYVTVSGLRPARRDITAAAPNQVFVVDVYTLGNDSIYVYRNGKLLVKGSGYTETSTSTVTSTSLTGEVWTFVVYDS